jgi:DNA modification methylase
MAVSILIGDVRERLRELPADSVDCVVTSPPYWGLRDYDVDGQIGLEPTLAEHLAVMVDVFREVRRVLKPTGTLWLNYGDCYATTPNGRSAADTKASGKDDRTFRDKPFSTVGAGIKAKDLCMIPNRLAIALQDDGWWVRAECIWGKPNSMPDSSGSQRPATAHEKVFMLAKSEDADVWRARDTGEVSFAPDLTERCALITDPEREGARWIRIGSYYDASAVLQGRAGDEDARIYRGGSYVGGQPGPRATTGNKRIKMPDGWDTGAGGHGSHHRKGREKGKQVDIAAASPSRARARRTAGFNERWDEAEATGAASGGRFLRNYEPAPLSVWEIAIAPFKDAHFATFPPELAERCLRAGCPPGGSVLDPFGGAGTTALVAAQLGMNCTLIELSPAYAAIADRRLRAGLCRVDTAPAPVSAGPLFGSAA